MENVITDYYIDFETLDINPNTAVVLSCAVTPVERDGIPDYDAMMESSLYMKFNTDEQMSNGRTVSESTLDFWAKQDPELAKLQLEPSDQDVSLYTFPEKVFEFIGQKACEHSVLWCRGSEFDFNLLNSIILETDDDRFQLDKFPIGFWNRRDIRSYISGLFSDPNITKFDLPEEHEPKQFIKHNPVHDNCYAAVQIAVAEKYLSS